MEHARVKLQVRGDKQKKDQHEKKSWDKGGFRELPGKRGQNAGAWPCIPHYMTVTGKNQTLTHREKGLKIQQQQNLYVCKVDEW